MWTISLFNHRLFHELSVIHNDFYTVILVTCSGDHCEIEDLDPFTTYKCTFSAIYNKAKFMSVNLTETTLSAGEYNTGFITSGVVSYCMHNN